MHCAVRHGGDSGQHFWLWQTGGSLVAWRDCRESRIIGEAQCKNISSEYLGNVGINRSIFFRNDLEKIDPLDLNRFWFVVDL